MLKQDQKSLYSLSFTLCFYWAEYLSAMAEYRDVFSHLRKGQDLHIAWGRSEMFPKILCSDLLHIQHSSLHYWSRCLNKWKFHIPFLVLAVLGIIEDLQLTAFLCNYIKIMKIRAGPFLPPISHGSDQFLQPMKKLQSPIFGSAHLS